MKAIRRRSVRRSWWALSFLVLLAVVIVGAWLAVDGNRVVLPETGPTRVQVTDAQLAQGRYLARTADCISCHQAPDGSSAYGGGTPLKTPFGSIYGSNITSDPDNGIGRWSADDFYRAVTLGKAPGGRNLYPAMPYVSYHRMARQDSDLIYAYLMNVAPSARANQTPDIPFPLNMRVLLSGWNLLFFDKDPLPAASTGNSPAWLRGQYVANVMGHCAECHSPRGTLGQMKRGDDWMRGQMLDGLLAADLTPQELVRRGWTAHDLGTYVTQGASAQGVANGEMAQVVKNSGRYLTPGDAYAMSVFLLGDEWAAKLPGHAGAAAAPLAVTSASRGAAPTSPQLASARQDYLSLCAGCHGASGAGVPNTMPALDANSTVRERDSRGLLAVILHGLEAQRVPGGMAMGAMPGFADRLDDAAVAALANDLRARWATDLPVVQAQDVAAVRAAH